MLVWKELIPGPGSYWYKDQDSGLPRKITFTPEGLKHLHDQGKAMLAAGLSVPVPLEHQPDAMPLSAADTAAQRLKNNAGWTKDYRLTAKGGLAAQLDIDDPELFARLPRTVRWVSPYITSFTDGKGQEWRNVIGHNALTARPRITDQQPFPSLAAALSLAAGLPEETFDGKTPLGEKGVGVLAAGRLVGEGEGLRPAYPVAFSLLTGARLAREEMPKADEDEGEDEAPADVEHPAGNPAEDRGAGPGGAAAEHRVDPDGDISVWEVLSDLLESEGFALPPGTSQENFAERMYDCLMNKLKAKGPGAEDAMGDTKNQPPTGQGNDLPPNPPVVAEQPPLYMSLEQAEKIQDPQLRQLARVALSLQNQALEAAQARRQERIERLCKKVRQQGFQDKLLAQASGARLSLTPEGAVHDPLAGVLDVLEAGVRDLPSLLTEPGRLRELEHPREYDGGAMTEERRKEVLGEFVRNTRLPEPGPRPGGG
jgi:hypothetical protein